MRGLILAKDPLILITLPFMISSFQMRGTVSFSVLSLWLLPALPFDHPWIRKVNG